MTSLPDMTYAELLAVALAIPEVAQDQPYAMHVRTLDRYQLERFIPLYRR